MTVVRCLAALGVSALTLSACATSEHVDGQLPNLEKLAALDIGVHTRDDVTKLIGTPSTTSLFDDDNWYYIKRVTQQVAFLEPVVMDQKIVAIVFNEEGKLADIVLYHEEDGHDIVMVERITPTHGRKLSIWEQLLSNFGRVPEGSPMPGPGR